MSHIHGDSIEEIEMEAEEKMEKTISDLGREMATIRTGRASVHLLDPIKVDYYGAVTPLNQMATITTPEASLITVQPWDATQIGAIERAIQQAELELNPQNDGKIIRIAIPALNEERRRELAKHLHQMTEMHRVAARAVRRDANEALKKLEKDSTISEDEGRSAHDGIQELTDATIKKLDEASAVKEKEIMEIG